MRKRRWAAAALVVLMLAGASTRTAVAAPGEDNAPIANPDLPPGCGIDIHVILDESTSIQQAGATDDVRRAFRAFTSALRNTGSRMAVSEFSTVARLPLSGAANGAYTTVTDATIASTFDPYITFGFNPNGSTNWEDAFRIGRYFLPRPSEVTPHLVVFITDGDPNKIVRSDQVTYDPGNPNVAQNEYELKVPLAENETVGANENPAKDRAVPNANAVKAQGSHILTVAVGRALSSPAALARIIAVSGPDVFAGDGAFDITTDDVYRVADFSHLEDALRDAAFRLCAPSVNVRKLIDANPDPTVDDLQPGQGWSMTANVAPAPAAWVLPQGATGATATGTTGPDGFVNFQWTTAAPTSSTIAVTEEVQPGFTNDQSATTCTYRTPDSPQDRPLPGFSATAGGFSGIVPEDAIVTCQMVNRIPAAPAIEIEKSTNGDDADAAPGPFVPIGTTVTWTYRVTNTGNVPLSDIAVTDDRGVTVDCPGTSLDVADVMTCRATGTAQPGQYENTGAVTAVGASQQVGDSDPSHYFGVAPGIDIEKFTNGDDADEAPGPFIPVGGGVTWTYEVTNTGNAALTGVTVTDDQGVTVSCPQPTLAASASMTCTAPVATAVAGQYENTGSVTGTAADGTLVQDSDASHYFGAAPSVVIEKSTNQFPADTPPGPQIAVGGPVTWQYRVTNNGNVPLVDWQPTDSRGEAVACPRLVLLFPGRSVTCIASGTAQAGQYTNIATVTAHSAVDPSAPPVTATDPSHYFGVQGAIDLEKATNGLDADAPPGPFVAIGGLVTWTYQVTNTGNSTLTDVAVTDLRGVALSCPQTTLAVGESMICTGTGVAQAGQYTNFAIAEARTPLNEPVADGDPSNFFGAQPGIHLEKDTNGVDADDAADAPLIPVGDAVTWTYRVTNTGNNALSDISVTDDQGVTVSCPAEPDPLPAGDALTCSATGTATRGEYANTGSVTATDLTEQEVSDDDPSHYFGVESAIHVEKLTNGVDADDPPGPRVAVGDTVTWTYHVTNAGNIAIRDVRVVDDRGIVPRFVSGDTDDDTELDPAETWTFEASGTAVAGQYGNIATVTGVDVLERELSDSDPSHYIAESPTQPPATGEAASQQQASQATPRPSLHFQKRADRTRVRAGHVVRFRLQVRNSGRGTARNVRVCDPLPAGLVFARAQGAQIQGRRACFTIRTLGPRRTRTFVVSTRVDSISRPRTVCNVAVGSARSVTARSARACIRVLPRVVRRGGGVTG